MANHLHETRRKRVRGDGPDRKELRTWTDFGPFISGYLCDELLEYARNMENDLGTDRYRISEMCDLTTMFRKSGDYRQILLQEPENDGIEETDYTRWRDDEVVQKLRKDIERYTRKPFRTRIAIVPPKAFLDWHIDTNTSVACRHQIQLSPKPSLFLFDRKGVREELVMHQDHLYFVNTGWKHAVRNDNDTDRVVVIFDTSFSDIDPIYKDSMYLSGDMV